MTRDATLPSFLVVGAGKAGTTSLYNLLSQHPQVYMPEIKETNFFGWDADRPGERLWPSSERNVFPVRDLEGYRELFSNVKGYRAAGEASPLYLESRLAPARIRETVPDVRLIVTLRDPVERAYSGFKMKVQNGFETRSVSDAFSLEEHRVQAGFYHRMLKRYFDLFPREQIMVLIFEEWRSDMVGCLSKVFEFIDVDPAFQVDLRVDRNESGVPKSRLVQRLISSGRLRSAIDPMLPEAVRALARRLARRNLVPAPPLPADVRDELISLYRPDVEALERLIERRLAPPWLVGSSA